MGKIGTKLPSFCLNRIRPHVRVRSPPIQSKPTDSADITRNGGKVENCGNAGDEKAKDGDGAKKPGVVFERKIMIVVDSSVEAKGALQWALSHTIQNQDKLVLLHVTKPSTSKQGEDIISPRAYELVHSLRNMCHLKKPEIEYNRGQRSKHIASSEVQTEVAVMELGKKEKGPTIVEEARKQRVSLLVLGQKKRSTTWRLLMMWAGSNRGGGSGGGGGVVEYCIQNASCMAIAVRRNSKKVGGYLITTKRQKDFWLLA